MTMPDGINPLFEPMLTSHQWWPVLFTWRQFHMHYSWWQSLRCVTKLHPWNNSKICLWTRGWISVIRYCLDDLYLYRGKYKQFIPLTLREVFWSRPGTIYYIPQILWDVITCLCHWYLLLAQHSSYGLSGKWNKFHRHNSKKQWIKTLTFLLGTWLDYLELERFQRCCES